MVELLNVIFRFSNPENDLKTAFYFCPRSNRYKLDASSHFRDILEKYIHETFVIDGVKFIPNLAFKPRYISGDSLQNVRYRFEQNGRIIEEIQEKGANDKVVIEVIERSMTDGLPESQKFGIDKNDPKVYTRNNFQMLYVTIKIFGSSNDDNAKRIFVFPASTWKTDLKSSCADDLTYLGPLPRAKNSFCPSEFIKDPFIFEVKFYEVKEVQTKTYMEMRIAQ